jgi:5-hydroxyisourate hydrolase-like protein (transthyretin family)
MERMSVLLKTINTLYALLVATLVAFVGGFIILFPQITSPDKISQTCVLPETVYGNVEIVSNVPNVNIDCRRQNITVAETGRVSFIGNSEDVVSPEVLVRSLTVVPGGNVDVVAIQNTITPTIMFAGTVSMQQQTVSESAKVSTMGRLLSVDSQVLGVNTNQSQQEESSYIQLSSMRPVSEVLGESVSLVPEEVFTSFSIEEFVATALHCSSQNELQKESEDLCYKNNSVLYSSTNDPSQFSLLASGQVSESVLVAENTDDISAQVLGASGKVVNLGGIVNQNGQVTLKAEVRPQFYFETPKNIQLEFEIKTIQEPFDATTGIFLSEQVVSNGVDPISVGTTIDYLPQNQAFKWRVRVIEVVSQERGDWVSFGENGEYDADFIVTSAVSLKLEAEKYSLGTEDKVTITVSALNKKGEIDPNYEGFVKFRSDSTSADLPKTYKFTRADKGQKQFTQKVKFYEPGVRYVTAYDAINSSLTNTIAFSVTQPDNEYFVLTSSQYSLLRGEKTTMMWSSRGMPQILLPNGETSNLATGTFEVNPEETQYVSIGAVTPEGTNVYAGARVDVNNADSENVTREDVDPVLFEQKRLNEIASPQVKGISTIGGISKDLFPEYIPDAMTANAEIPQIEQPNVCPIIESFTYDKPFIKNGTLVHFSWRVKDAEQVVIDVIPGNLSQEGHAAMTITETTTITLKAISGTCHRTMSLPVTIVSVFPWEATGAWIVGIISLETIGLFVVPLAAPGVKYNLFFGLASLLDRMMKRKKWGVVFDLTTQKTIAGVKVSLYSKDKKVLYDYSMTDNYGCVYLRNVAPGQYRIEFEKIGYEHGVAIPKKMKIKDMYVNAITSSEITVTKEGLSSQYTFPMVESKKVTKQLWYHSLLLVEELANVSLPLLIIVGGFYAIAITILYPITMNLLLLSMYVLLVLAKLLNYMFTKYTVGTVRTVTGMPVANVQVALYDRKSDTLIAQTYTNKAGKYVFFVGKGDYKISITDPSYKLVNKGGAKSGVIVTNKEQTIDQVSVGKDIIVYPAMPL